MPPDSPNKTHLKKVAAYFDEVPTPSRPSRAYRRELSVYHRAFVQASASVLEIGCGDGSLLAALPNRDVCGVDISEAMITKARESVPHGEFHVMSGEDINLDRTFDYIILSDVLNLCYDVQDLL